MSRLTQLWVIVAASAAAAGCATTEPGKPGRREMPSASAPAPVPAACDGHVLQVKIKDITATSAGGITIKVPRKVQIGGSKAGANWTLETSGYVFVPTGVVIESGSPPTASFSNGSDQYGLCFESTTAHAEWKYSVLFKKIGDSVIWYCDPTIVNFDSIVVSPLDDDPLACTPLKPTR